MSARQVEFLIAFLIALYAFAIPRFVVQVFGLPIPMLGALSPLFILILPVGLSLIVVTSREDRKFLFTPADFSFLLFFIGIIFLEVVHGLLSESSFFFATQTFFAYFTFWLTRSYIVKFGNRAILENFVCYIGILLFLFHLFLLIALKALGYIPGIVASEVLQRNGISFLAVGVCFIVWFSTDRILPGYLANFFLPALVVVHCVLNGGRAAFVTLIALAGSRFVFRAHKSNLGAWIFFVLVGIGAVLFASGSQLVEKTIPLLSASGDDAFSMLSRLATNRLLFAEFIEGPLVGIGMQAVQEIRIGGYMSHTYLMLPLAAYGLLGFVPLLVTAKLMCAHPRSPIPPPPAAFAFMILVLLFVNDIWPWLTLSIALVTFHATARETPTISTKIPLHARKSDAIER